MRRAKTVQTLQTYALQIWKFKLEELIENLRPCKQTMNPLLDRHPERIVSQGLGFQCMGEP
jgi:hypothetical protein